MKAVLSRFKDILFAHNQLSTFLSSAFMTSKICVRSSLSKQTVVSSAKWTNLSTVEHLHMSLMYIKKSKGPSMEPWGTPMLIGSWDELNPFIDTYCLRLERYGLIRSRLFAWTYLCNSYINMQFFVPRSFSIKSLLFVYLFASFHVLGM